MSFKEFEKSFSQPNKSSKNIIETKTKMLEKKNTNKFPIRKEISTQNVSREIRSRDSQKKRNFVINSNRSMNQSLKDPNEYKIQVDDPKTTQFLARNPIHYEKILNDEEISHIHNEIKIDCKNLNCSEVPEELDQNDLKTIQNNHQQNNFFNNSNYKQKIINQAKSNLTKENTSASKPSKLLTPDHEALLHSIKNFSNKKLSIAYSLTNYINNVNFSENHLSSMNNLLNTIYKEMDKLLSLYENDPDLLKKFVNAQSTLNIPNESIKERSQYEKANLLGKKPNPKNVSKLNFLQSIHYKDYDRLLHKTQILEDQGKTKGVGLKYCEKVAAAGLVGNSFVKYEKNEENSKRDSFNSKNFMKMLNESGLIFSKQKGKNDLERSYNNYTSVREDWVSNNFDEDCYLDQNIPKDMITICQKNNYSGFENQGIYKKSMKRNRFRHSSNDFNSLKLESSRSTVFSQNRNNVYNPTYKEHQKIDQINANISQKTYLNLENMSKSKNNSGINFNTEKQSDLIIPKTKGVPGISKTHRPEF